MSICYRRETHCRAGFSISRRSIESTESSSSRSASAISRSNVPGVRPTSAGSARRPLFLARRAMVSALPVRRTCSGGYRPQSVGDTQRERRHMPGWLQPPELTACQLKLQKDLPLTLSLSWDVAQALEKILSPATVECRYGTIDLRALAVSRALAAPHCTIYKAVELVRNEYST